MSQVRLGVADAADIRFAISPLWETVRSVSALGDPGRYAVHLPFLRPAAELARRREVVAHVRLLSAFARPGAWLPDFLTPPPAGPLAELAGELDTLRATDPAVVVADIDATVARSPLTGPARVVRDDPVTMLPRLAEAIRAWHDAAIAPHWPRMRALLDADIAYRARQLAEGGVRRLIDTLHPTVRWAGDRIIGDDPWGFEIDLAGRGLPLMPSVFVDRRVQWVVRPQSPPLAVYPARGVALLWQREQVPRGVRSLALVLGRARSRLLVLLAVPATTTELARSTGLSRSAVSQHLSALYAAGLVSRSRQGRDVRYTNTDAGTALLRANDLAD